MNFKKFKPDTVKIDTLIGAKAIFNGTISGKGNFKLDGTVDGDVLVDGDVIIDKKAVVTGNVDCKNIIVAGTVNGNVNSKATLTIKSSACVLGKCNAKNIAVEDGATLNGTISISAIETEEESIELQ
ncbi:MAG: polymer-forming cytoskeletal protein [Clostridia bacterium]|nr:polymer-forming cytoskeletal protein [Clostridia bacterium]MBQ4543325.1 polymer-forming cytoskeletal protein [Clostridia bacterium]